MGEIKKILAQAQMPPREPHTSRLFVDLAENVHIHFRDWRTVFSIPEFFEYSDAISRSARDLKRYLRWHPQYKEQQVFDTIMIAMGAEQQTRPLRESPKPHQSTYFDDRMQIELQAEQVIDEIHIHYRDYRLAMDRDTFRTFASAVSEAAVTLDGFLSSNTYERIEHPFRKEVVKDTYYEARSWTPLRRTGIPLRDRLKAMAFHIGGERLERLFSGAYRFVRTIGGIRP